MLHRIVSALCALMLTFHIASAQTLIPEAFDLGLLGQHQYSAETLVKAPGIVADILSENFAVFQDVMVDERADQQIFIGAAETQLLNQITITSTPDEWARILIRDEDVLDGVLQAMVVKKSEPLEVAAGCGDLGAKFQKGEFEMVDIPCYATYLTELVIFVAGIAAVFFIVIGGYQYVSSGAIEENRENAKKTIMYAIIGLIATVVAWTVVNVWQVFLTGG